MEAVAGLEAIKCLHREDVSSTPALPGIETGICSRCGQEIQYDHRGMTTKVTVVKLGRIGGKIVIPKKGLDLMLSPEDKKDLDAVKSNQISTTAAEAESPPEVERVPSPESPKTKKYKKRQERNQYFQSHKQDIIHEYYTMILTDFYRKWGLSSHLWLRLKREWKVSPKGPVNKYTKHLMKSPTDKHNGKKKAELPPLPPFNENWPPSVKVQWLRTYQELMLAE